MKTQSAKLTPTAPDTLAIPYKGGVHRICPQDIIRLEADSNYTFIYVRGQRPLFLAKVLRAFEAELLPYGFIRTHRSHLVNPRYIAGLNQDEQLLMQDQSQLEISRRRRKAVLRYLHLWPAAA